MDWGYVVKRGHFSRALIR